MNKNNIELNQDLDLNTQDLILQWIKTAKVEHFPEDGGACVNCNGEQIAVFNFSMRSEWYATQNLCPHKHEMAISRGIIGDLEGEPKVACPFHKKNFSLKNGSCLGGEDYKLKTYPVKIKDGYVFIGF